MGHQKTKERLFPLNPVYPKPYLFLVVGISGELWVEEFSDLGSCETCPLSGVFWPAGGLSLRDTWGQQGDSTLSLALR